MNFKNDVEVRIKEFRVSEKSGAIRPKMVMFQCTLTKKIIVVSMVTTLGYL